MQGDPGQVILYPLSAERAQILRHRLIGMRAVGSIAGGGLQIGRQVIALHCPRHFPSRLLGGKSQVCH
nr:hypothetical protein GCM10017611_73020 [Rhodococcus wratislaviensis]